MADTDILVSEMTPASQINTTDLMIMTQPDAQAETGYNTKSGTVLQVANKMLKGTEYSTDLPDFTDKTPLGGLEELKGDIQSLLPVGTASGAVANFNTDIATNLVSVKCSIEASGGGGTPSTPIPIVGHSELNLVRCGKNLIRDEFVSGLPSTSIGDDYDSIITTTRYAYLNLPNVNGNVTVSITDYDANYIDWVILFGYTNGKLSGKHQINNFSGSTVNLSGYDHLRIIIGAVAGYIVPSAISTVGKVQLELGSTATAYEPYNGTTDTIALGSTVYGGELDVTTGVLTVTHDHIASYNGESINEPWISSMDEYVPNTSPSTGAEVVYPMTTPQTVQLTPTHVQAILGDNNVFCDTGDSTVKYKVGIQKYIDDKIAEVQALVL